MRGPGRQTAGRRLFILARILAAIMAGWMGLSLPLPAYATTVVIDPGHGGRDPGAVSKSGVQEKTVTLAVAKRLQQDLIHNGYEALLTRTADRYVGLQQRLDIAAADRGDLFVSIHANWYDNPQAAGTLVLYYDAADPSAVYPASASMIRLSPESKLLAQAVLDHVLASAGTQNQGLVPSHVYVVRNSDIPSILVETGFLSNPAEAARLAEPAFQAQLAQGIADGIASYMPNAFSDIAGNWAERAIADLKSRGVISGYAGRFHPEQPMTRAEFASLVIGLREKLPQLPDGGSTAGTAAVAGDGAAQADAGAGSAAAPAGQDAAQASAANPLSGAAAGGAGGGPNPAAGGSDSEAAGSGGAADSGADGASASEGGSAAPQPQPAAAQPAPSGGTDAPSAGMPPADAPLDFSDVKPQDWDYGVIRQAAAAGIVTGYSDGTFRPGEPITREEAVVMLEQLIGPGTAIPNQNPPLPFRDVAGKRWSEPELYAAWRDGIIAGSTSATFEPARNITRAEGAAIADRLLAAKLAGTASTGKPVL